MDKITVFLSDWQVLFREGIHFTLSGEEDLIVTGETTGNRDALNFVTGNPPDIAVVNINHDEFSGAEFTRQVRRNFPLVSVILVMDTENEDQLYSAVRCGAACCVAKDIDPEELVGFIRRIAAGSLPISRAILQPSIASRIIDEFESYSMLNGEVDNLLADLTAKETSLLHSIAEGDTLDDIEAKSGIDPDTVSKLLAVIRTKLVENEHCRDVVEAAQKGLSSVIKRTRRGKKTEEFISREEFESFRDSLIDHFKNFTDH